MNIGESIKGIGEIFGFFRDLNDPAKREARYRLYIEKRAERALKAADRYIDHATKYDLMVKVVLEPVKKDIGSDDLKELRRFRKYMRHFEKRFRAYN